MRKKKELHIVEAYAVAYVHEGSTPSISTNINNSRFFWDYLYSVKDMELKGGRKMPREVS